MTKKARLAARAGLAALAMGALATGTLAAPAYEPPKHDLPPQVQQHVDMAYLLWNGAVAQDLLPMFLSGLVTDTKVTPPPLTVAAQNKAVAPPVKAFDQLVYLGMNTVGAWALKTSGGIILFDTLDNEQEARDIIEGGLRKVGWDPAQIKYIVITHGHGDHYGGAKYLQDKYHPRILAGAADWGLMANAPTPQGRAPTPVPKHDMDVADGQKLTLGDTTVTLYLTPGHTLDTVSAIIPATEHGRRHLLSFWGGTGAPQTLGPNERAGGLLAYRNSLERFTKIGIDAGVDGIISNHPVNDDSYRKAVSVKNRPNQASPWVTGKAGYQLYMGGFLEAVEAVIASKAGKP